MDYNRRSFLRRFGGLAVIASGLEVLVNLSGCSKQDEPKILTPITPDVSDKKVFLYTQRAYDKNESSKLVSDFMHPHFFDLNRTYKTETSSVTVLEKGNKIKKTVKKTVVDDTNIKLRFSNGFGNKSIDDFLTRVPNAMPMIGCMEEGAIKEVLDHPERYTSMIANKVIELKVKGVSIDFESVKVKSDYSLKLVNFMELLRTKLPQNQYTISIAVSPRFYTFRLDGNTKKTVKDDSATNGYSHHGFYDLSALSKHVDYVHLMCYDFHKGKAGVSPVLPHSQLKNVLEYAKDHIPSEKTVILLPFYGALWKDKTRNRRGKTQFSKSNPKPINPIYSDQMVDGENVIVQEFRDGELYLRLSRKTSKGLEIREVYAQTPQTFEERFAIIDKYNIKNVGAWRENGATEDILDVFYEWKKK